MFKHLYTIGSIVIAMCISQVQAAPLTAEKAEQLTEQAYIFAYPMMQNYKSLYSRTVLGKKPLNTFSHRPKLLGPDFKAIVGPNNDTLYSAAWLDLRKEAMVISVPEVPDNRYYSIQLIDMFTHNFAYIGQRATGNEEGSYLIAGPNQKSIVTPETIDKTYHSESNFVFVIGRMLAKGEADETEASKLLQEYKMQSLAQFLGQADELTTSNITLPEYTLNKVQSTEFIELFNFLLQFVEIHSSEKKLLNSFASIGIKPGANFDLQNYPTDIQHAITRGVNNALKKIEDESKLIGTQVAGWNTTYLGFGPREVMQGQYLLRAAAAMIAIYGNNREENSSFSRQVDQNRQPLDGSIDNNSAVYTLRFTKDKLPQSNAFWSLTMYQLPEVLLYANDAKRYAIGDRTKDLKYAKDGSLTLYIQHLPPSSERISNWLPAPAGPFALALRTYLPKPSVYNGEWLPPEVIRIK